VRPDDTEPTAIKPRTRRRPPSGDGRRSDRGAGVGSGWKTFGGHVALIVFKVLLPVMLLIAVAAGIGYVRLANGPVSLSFLSEPIARGISAELDGLRAEIDDTLIAVGRRGIEVRLVGLKLVDVQRRTVALAPLATIDLSASALLQGRLAPRHVVLVEPRMLVSIGDDGRVALTMSQAATPSRDVQPGTGTRPAERVPSAARPGATVSGATAPGGGDVSSGADTTASERNSAETGRLDLARALVDAARRARVGTQSASFLRTIGVRDAGLILDSRGRRTAWRLPSASISLRHLEDSSRITADAVVISEGQTWNLVLDAVDDAAADGVRLTVTLRDLVPGTLARLHPAWTVLEGLKLPVGVNANMLLSRAGDVQSWQALVALGQGDVSFAAMSGLRTGMSGGTLDLRYDIRRRQIDLMPSTLAWAGGRLTFAGAMAPASGGAGDGRWLFEIGGVDGELASAARGGTPVRIEQLRVAGELMAAAGRLDIKSGALTVGGTTIEASGWLGGDGARLADRVNVEGRIGPMSRGTMQALWPRALSPALYDWVASEVETVEIAGGAFRIGGGENGDLSVSRGGDRTTGVGRGTPGDDGVLPTMLSLEIGAARFRPAPGLPPIDVKRALYRLEGTGFEIAIPEARLDLGEGRSIVVGGARVATADWWNPAAEAEVAFRLAGGLAEAIELLEQPLFGIGRLSLPPGATVQGKAEGQFQTRFALYADPQRRAAQPIEGSARIVDGRLRNAGPISDVRGLSVAFELTDKAISAAGSVLLAGVPAKLTWQRILSGGAGEQPPLRVTATLDNAERRQLGIDLSHVMQGEVAVEATLPMAKAGEAKARVRVDLSTAELFLQSLAWTKPPGRPAALQFDVFEADKASRHRTELRNLSLVGDGIAISGSAALDAKGQLRQFELPQFSINTVSRLALKGELTRDNVWKVAAEGPTYDGQDVFRALFAIGGASEPQNYATKGAPGLDLEARIANVIGFSETSWRGVTLKLGKRGGKLSSLFARGTLDGGKSLEVGLQSATNAPRRLVALSDDAGQAFRLVGFYPNMQGGRMRLDANLDERGGVERTGVLQVENFQILGDPVLGEVVESYSGTDANQGVVRRRVGQSAVVRQSLLFDRLRAPFSVGNGQFVLRDAELRGPLLGASLSGKADYLRSTVDIGGTYVPLQALNAALGAIPGLGQLLTGPRGDGVWAMNFAIQGPMSGPEVIVHPLSMIAPGIFRDLFQIQGAAPRVTAPPRTGTPPAVPPRASGSEPARRSDGNGLARPPELTDGWTSRTQRP